MSLRGGNEMWRRERSRANAWSVSKRTNATSTSTTKDIQFVARLGAQVSGGDSDILDWSPTSSQIGGNQILQKTARVSDRRPCPPAQLRREKNCTSSDSKGRPELYRSGPGEGVACVSCDPTGQAPTGGAYVQKFPLILLGPRPPYGINPATSSRMETGLLQLPDQLVAGNEDGVTDVYEWAAGGTGSCKSEVENGGCLYLISTGTSDQPSYSGDADESGNNAFIFTASRLVPQDQDKLIDVYEAHVGGGVAGQNQVEPVPCEVEACPSARRPPHPITRRRVRRTSSVPEIRKGSRAVPEGKVRRHGRCVKKSKKRHHGNRRKKARDTRDAMRVRGRAGTMKRAIAVLSMLGLALVLPLSQATAAPAPAWDVVAVPFPTNFEKQARPMAREVPPIW